MNYLNKIPLYRIHIIKEDYLRSDNQFLDCRCRLKDEILIRQKALVDDVDKYELEIINRMVAMSDCKLNLFEYKELKKENTLIRIKRYDNITFRYIYHIETIYFCE
jgi:hypothetical protein